MIQCDCQENIERICKNMCQKDYNKKIEKKKYQHLNYVEKTALQVSDASLYQQRQSKQAKAAAEAARLEAEKKAALEAAAKKAQVAAPVKK